MVKKIDMKNLILLFASIMILLIPQSGNTQLAVELKYGFAYGQVKNLDMYKEVTMSKYGNHKIAHFSKIPPPINKSIALKYFFNKRFFTGFQMDFYEFETDNPIDKIVFKDYNYIETKMSFIYLQRKRINSSFLLGYHILYGFYLETGLSYMYNEKNILHGARHDYTGLPGKDEFITTKLSDQNFDKSSNFAGYGGLGFRYRKNGLYFMIDYKYFIEQPTQFSEDSKFKLRFDTQLFTIGLGYKFGKSAKKTDEVVDNYSVISLRGQRHSPRLSG